MDAVGEYLAGAFMWMFEVRLAGGRPLHAYKHIDTRRYVHLDLAGNAFVYLGGERYGRIALADALEGGPEPLVEGLNASVEDTASSWSVIERARRPGEPRSRQPDGT